ncbi:MAG TPA: hypothetical protein VFT82_00575 [Candidatus Paceibacterota bacterium]|nr:hypothetical protein [Candidatus Paceibacterota bacterium]
MSRKAIITTGLIIGSFAGGYIPSLWGADFISFSGLLFSAIGAIAGIWIAFKLTS